MAHCPATSDSSEDATLEAVNSICRQPVELIRMEVGNMMPKNQTGCLRYDAFEKQMEDPESGINAWPRQVEWFPAHSLAGGSSFRASLLVDQLPSPLREIRSDIVHERFALVFHVSLTYYIDKAKDYAGDKDGKPRPLVSLREQWQSVQPEKVKRAVIVLHNTTQPDLRAVGELVRDLSSILFFRDTRRLDSSSEIDERSLAKGSWFAIEHSYESSGSEIVPCGWPLEVVDAISKIEDESEVEDTSSHPSNLYHFLSSQLHSILKSVW